MVQYRYHRMATNELGWRRPQSGRLGKTNDYVGMHGYGHEDWNFAGDIWKDGKYHLYLRQGPAQAARGEVFNIALGARTPAGHVLVGFAENVRYEVVDLDDEIWERRARELKLLDDEGELGGEFKGLELSRLISRIKEIELHNYSVAVAPEDLTILHEECLIPDHVISVKSNRYQLRKLTESEYDELRSLANAPHPSSGPAEESFPEGAILERVHRYRERDHGLVAKAKELFIAKHGRLFCEVCQWSPEVFFGPQLRDKVIEAHHDVPLSSHHHGGQTRVQDLRMLCPNCHRAIHTIRPWQMVDDFRARFGAQ